MRIILDTGVPDFPVLLFSVVILSFLIYVSKPNASVNTPKNCIKSRKITETPLISNPKGSEVNGVFKKDIFYVLLVRIELS